MRVNHAEPSRATDFFNSLLESTTSHVTIDRIVVCFTDPNLDNVKGTLGLLLSDKYNKLPGLSATKTARYAARFRLLLPFDGPDRHPICFEVGPHDPKLPSYRLDFNPSKVPLAGIDDLKVLLETTVDETSFAFFSSGRITRVDIAVNLSGLTLEDVIVRSKRKQKHGVYSDRSGRPQTVYLGTPRSNRTVAYTKSTGPNGNSMLRIECRVRPRCQGYELAKIKNPFMHVDLLPAKPLGDIGLPVPPEIVADSIRGRGLARVASKFDPITRKAIMHALSNPGSLLPTPSELWTGWPQALINAGLGKELGAIP
jgi:hypothetical protein